MAPAVARRRTINASVSLDISNKRRTAQSDLMRLRAVQSFLIELERANRTAITREEPSQTTPPHLVTTRRYSGRLQTGCVGGCFR